MRPIKAISVSLAVILSAGGVLMSCSNNNKPGSTPLDKVGDVPKYTYKTDVSQYVSAMNSESHHTMLANKQNPLGRDYVPMSLVRLDPSITAGGKEILLDSTAAEATEALLAELLARGYGDIVVTSGYRTYARQEYLFNYYTEQEMAKNSALTRAQAEAIALQYSARAGTSEHQTGLCVDLISSYATELDESFAENAAYPWLVENAHQFGFILRYPKDKEDITGYKYEPWHYRFVGRQAAYEMYMSGLTLEEYLAEK